MPRKTKRHFLKPIPTKKNTTPYIDKQPTSNQQPNSMIGNIGQGMTLGAGAAIGSSMVHGVMDTISSNGDVENKNSSYCDIILKEFQICSNNTTDLNTCKSMMDLYTQCLKNYQLD